MAMQVASGSRIVPRTPGPEERVDNDIGSVKQGLQGEEVIPASEWMERDPAMRKCCQLVGAGAALLPEIEVTDVRIRRVLEVACRHHPVTAVVPSPAEDEHPLGTGGKYRFRERPACALHHLEGGHTERYRIRIDSPHPGRGDHPGLQKPVHLFRPHTQCTIHVYELLNNIQWVFAMMSRQPQNRSRPHRK